MTHIEPMTIGIYTIEAVALNSQTKIAPPQAFFDIKFQEAWQKAAQMRRNKASPVIYNN
ncbi:hypothetical protein SATMO3_26360 [Sporomusa aerivorans]